MSNEPSPGTNFLLNDKKGKIQVCMLLKTKISHVSDVLLAISSLSFEEHLAVGRCHSSFANSYFLIH